MWFQLDEIRRDGKMTLQMEEIWLETAFSSRIMFDRSGNEKDRKCRS